MSTASHPCLGGRSPSPGDIPWWFRARTDSRLVRLRSRSPRDSACPPGGAPQEEGTPCRPAQPFYRRGDTQPPLCSRDWRHPQGPPCLWATGLTSWEQPGPRPRRPQASGWVPASPPFPPPPPPPGERVSATSPGLGEMIVRHRAPEGLVPTVYQSNEEKDAGKLVVKCDSLSQLLLISKRPSGTIRRMGWEPSENDHYSLVFKVQ